MALDKREMKINFQFFTVLSSVGVNLVAATTNTCDTATLTTPDHWKEWKCFQHNNSVASGSVNPGTRCYLGCDDGFFPFSDTPRKFYKCKQNGMWRPTELELSCKYDPDYWVPELNHLRQEYFKDHMNFDAIRLIEEAHLEIPPFGYFWDPWPLLVKINGNEGYTCDAEGTVDQHTADLLCEKAGFIGATFGGWFTQVPDTPDNKPLTVGEMHCPSTATDLTECHSSGWGNDAQCEYESVLWLTCFIFDTALELDCQGAIDEQTRICNAYGPQSSQCQRAHTVCETECQKEDPPQECPIPQ